MGTELLLQLLDYAWVVLFAGVVWVIKLGARTSALEREVIALHKNRDEDESRRAEQRREMIDTIANNHKSVETKLDRIFKKLLGT